ncbi:histone H1.0-like [Narcine bancroftii]|uniref:histone H1.0-like n=1 Tax=Narcine bancroftii TaxID=1343680 RepID=UPI003831A83F
MTENSTPAPPKAKRAKTAKKSSSHPKYSEMIIAAISALNNRSGVSRQAIQAYIKKQFKVSETSNSQVKLALKKLIETKVIRKVSGTGVSGSFLLVKSDDQKKVAKKAVKSPKKTTAARKPVAAKKSVKMGTKVKRPKVEKKKPKTPKKKVAPLKKVKAKLVKNKAKVKKTPTSRSSGKKSKK